MMQTTAMTGPPVNERLERPLLIASHWTDAVSWQPAMNQATDIPYRRGIVADAIIIMIIPSSSIRLIIKETKVRHKYTVPVSLRSSKTLTWSLSIVAL
jgi:hypothetical protein